MRLRTSGHHEKYFKFKKEKIVALEKQIFLIIFPHKKYSKIKKNH